MWKSPRRTSVRFAALLWLWATTLSIGSAAPHQGLVRFGGQPVPGVTVTATRGEAKLATITDGRGLYAFADLVDGEWTIAVEMLLFAPDRRHVEVKAGAPAAEWDLKLVPDDGIVALRSIPAAAPFQRVNLAASKSAAAPKPASQQPVDPDIALRAADGFLINGSVNNGASSTFAQLPAFGNFRRGQRSMYNGNIGLIVNNAIFDARSFSLTGQNTPKPSYSRMQGVVAFGGPIKIPGLIRKNGPVFTLNYQWTRNSNANTQTALMPEAAERAGDFSGRAPISAPLTGLPFAGNQIPQSRISSQARGLLNFYPEPNFNGSSRYNFQLPIVSGLHQDDLQTRVTKQIHRNFFSSNFNLQSTRTDTPNLFGFLNTGKVLGLNTGGVYRRSFSPRSFVNLGYQFSNMRSRLTPYFADRSNVSGILRIAGNNQDSANWGPPTLQFSSGVATLADVTPSLTRNQTSSLAVDAFKNKDNHNITFGGTYRRQQFNILTQQDPRGTFTFTGAATGNDFAGFLLGIPDTSAIAFGNADKYLRSTVSEAYVNDDWRVNPGLTINAGLRYEYWSPAREKYGRLVNLQVGPGFSSAVPLIGGQPESDRNNLAPRFGFSWKPRMASSMVIRGGYGVYYDTSVYQPIALQMSQQAPLSKTLRIANSSATPLTLANGFPSVDALGNTFGVDPRLRIGYAHQWQLSVQRDLRGGMQLTASYNGSRALRGQQQFLPNTYPAGTAVPCSGCPSGFTYLTSNGNATRQAGQVQLRRRLRSGFTAQIQYTWAKAIDNSALGGRGQGGSLIAQNWLDLSSERARSNFDQRHLLTAMIQYTTGMGLRGGALASGWRAKLLKEWTFGSMINAGSGLPLTPVYIGAVQGTGVTGSIRPDYTGAPLYDGPAGLFLNPAAFTAPAVGRWGNAGRNSINGPRQFVMNASIGRTFRSTDRVSADFRIEAANALNNVTYPAWNTVAGNAQFGLPFIANPMRTVQIALRMRF